MAVSLPGWMPPVGRGLRSPRSAMPAGLGARPQAQAQATGAPPAPRHAALAVALFLLLATQIALLLHAVEHSLVLTGEEAPAHACLVCHAADLGGQGLLAALPQVGFSAFEGLPHLAPRPAPAPVSTPRRFLARAPPLAPSPSHIAIVQIV